MAFVSWQCPKCLNNCVNEEGQSCPCGEPYPKSISSNDLTFVELVEANLSRVEKWHSLKDWSVLEWAGAMCGEAGEAANFAKKLKRVETDIANNDKRMVGLDVPKEQLIPMYREGVLKEYADSVIYGVLMCARAGATAQDIQNAIRKVFNQKSEEYGFPERI